MKDSTDCKLTIPGEGDENQEVGVRVVFTEDEQIRQLNARFKGEKKNTDVLAFSVDEKLGEGVYMLGEVVVNLQQARRQAQRCEVNEAEEVARLITHGVLHLLGYRDDHPESRREMFKTQEKILKSLEVKD